MLQYRKDIDGDIIKITALGEQNEQAEGSEIWLRKIIIDGKSYSFEQIFEEGWISKDGSLGWRVYEQPVGLEHEITGIIPYGEKRELIFENTKTYERYSFDLGSITNGDYKITLAVSDNCDKTRAWYQKAINLETLPSGSYALYIRNTVVKLFP